MKNKESWFGFLNLSIIGFGFFFGYLFIVNATYAYDDMLLFGRFSEMSKGDSFFDVVVYLLFGADLQAEYRTYGISRVAHYILYLAFERSLYLYPAFIWVSQVFSALVISRIFKFYGAAEASCLAISLAWLLTPFSVNWSFHHYTYALLPFQILLVACYFLLLKKSPSNFLMCVLGIALALTGEFHLVAVPIVLGIIYFERKRERMTVVPLFLMGGVFLFSIVSHRLVWGFFYQNPEFAQRFSFETLDFPSMFFRSGLALRSIWLSLYEQLLLIGSGEVLTGVLVGLVLAAICYFIFPKVKEDDSSFKKSNILFWIFLSVAVASLFVYFAVGIFTGQVHGVMPRRYGYGAFSSLGVALIIAGILLLKRHSRIISAVAIFFVSAFAAQAALVVIPNSRKVDKSIISSLEEAIKDGKEKSQGSFIYVSNLDQYQIGVADGATPGVRRDDVTATEFIQSPFYVYWTTHYYLMYVLDRDFASMPMPDDGPDRGNHFGWHPKARDKPTGIVLANLSLSSLDDPSLGNVVFNSYEEFLPNKFSRRIEKGVKKNNHGARDEFVVDSGSSSSLEGFWVADKKFGEQPALQSSWVKDYGYLNGPSTAFDNDSINPVYAYYRTNRHGAVAYQVTFRDLVRFEASFDFWEQWGRQPGERVFDLEVSWDGEKWAKVGRIDPAAMNGSEPFSVEISRAGADMMMFRLVHVRGDVPMIQGFRLRRLS
jgi:hypothetical protein